MKNYKFIVFNYPGCGGCKFKEMNANRDETGKVLYLVTTQSQSFNEPARIQVNGAAPPIYAD